MHILWQSSGEGFYGDASFGPFMETVKRECFAALAPFYLCTPLNGFLVKRLGWSGLVDRVVVVDEQLLRNLFGEQGFVAAEVHSEDQILRDSATAIYGRRAGKNVTSQAYLLLLLLAAVIRLLLLLVLHLL